MKSIVLLFVLALASIPVATNAQEGFIIDGRSWHQLDKENKIFYLAGYLKGAYRGMLIGLRDVDCVSHKEVANKAQQKYRDFVGKGNMQILFDEVEKVYQNTKNLPIEVDEVIVFAFTKLKGDMSAQKQEAWLDLLRTTNQ